MSARRFVAALAGFLLASVPVLRAGTSCDAATTSSAMHHSPASGHHGGDAHNPSHHPSKSCDSHDSDCCGFTGACGNFTFVAGHPVSPAAGAELPRITGAEVKFLSAPLAPLDPPPPRA